MKNKIATAVLALLSLATTSAKAQAPFTTSGNKALAISGVHNIEFPYLTTTPREIRGNSPNYGLSLFSVTTQGDGSAIWINGWDNASGGSQMQGSVQIRSFGLHGTRYAMEVTNNDPWGAGIKSLMKVLKNGQVVLAENATPFATSDKLTVDGDISFPTTASNPRQIIARSDNFGLSLFSNNTGSDGSAIWINGWNNTSGGSKMRGSISLRSLGPVNSTDYAVEIINHDPWASPAVTKSLVKVLKNGQMIIGNDVTSFPSTYKLIVKDGILTEKIKVALSTDAVNWSDFVFADDYQLRPLNEVESFVKKNKHLPEIPSAKEVYANGLDLAQMDAKLLQKIEELTLYVIKQQKEIEQLKKKVK